jgi:hypothetical protein
VSLCVPECVAICGNWSLVLKVYHILCSQLWHLVCVLKVYHILCCVYILSALSLKSQATGGKQGMQQRYGRADVVCASEVLNPTCISRSVSVLLALRTVQTAETGRQDAQGLPIMSRGPCQAATGWSCIKLHKASVC